MWMRNPSAAICGMMVSVPCPISVELMRIFTPARPFSPYSKSSAAFDFNRLSPSPVKPDPWPKNARPIPRYVPFCARPFEFNFRFSVKSLRARFFSSTSGVPIGSEITCPVPVVSPRCSAFFNRKASGAMPIAAATSSMCDSNPQMACGAPNPRNAPLGKVLVRNTFPFTKVFGHR